MVGKVLKSYYRKKLLKECIEEWGRSEEECRKALDELEKHLEERIVKGIKQVLEV